jgi:hypothetical protein
MKMGSMEVTVGANEAIIGAVIVITVGLMFVTVPETSADLFKQGFGALIAWGAGYAMGKKSEATP